MSKFCYNFVRNINKVMTKEQIMQENREEIIRLYKNNTSATKIANMFGTSTL